MSVMMMMPKRARSRLKKLLPEKRTKHSEAANNVSISGRNSNDDAQSDDARTVTDSEAEQAEQAEQAENPSTGTLPGPSTSDRGSADANNESISGRSSDDAQSDDSKTDTDDDRGEPKGMGKAQLAGASPSSPPSWTNSDKKGKRQTPSETPQPSETATDGEVRYATNLTNAAKKTVTDLEAASEVVKNFVKNVNESSAGMPEERVKLARENAEFLTRQKEKADEHVENLATAAKAITQDLNTASQVAKTVVADLKSIPTENMENRVASESQNTQFAEILQKVDQVIDGMQTKKYDDRMTNAEVDRRAEEAALFEGVRQTSESLLTKFKDKEQEIEKNLNSVSEGIAAVQLSTQQKLNKISEVISESDEKVVTEWIRDIAQETAKTIISEVEKQAKAESQATGTSSIPQAQAAMDVESDSETSRNNGSSSVAELK
eukprot:gene27118-33364_t